MADRWQGGGWNYEPHRPPVNPRPHPGVLVDRQQQIPGEARPGGRPPAPPRPRRRRGRRIAGIILVLLLVGLTAAWFYIDSSMHRVTALSDYTGRPAQGTGTN